MRWTHLVVAVTILGLAGLVFAAKGDKPKKEGGHGLSGVISAVDGKTLKIKVGEEEKSVTTDDNTVVTIDKLPAKLAELKAGMHVRVSPATGTATKVDASTKGAGGKGKKKKNQ